MSHSKIINNLYLGNQYSTSIIKNVDTIISIGCKSKANNIKNVYKISVRDKKSSDLTPFLGPVTEYIDEELIKNSIRKLTPLECERLQGLPDNYTKDFSNTTRYKMIGNGFTVQVIKYILSNIGKTKLKQEQLSLFHWNS